jgi:Phage tail assembly chaperone protein
MPYFVAVVPETLQIAAMYEYTEADPSREPEATHIQVVPPMDYRAVLVSKDAEGNIQLTPDTDKMNEMYKYEYQGIRSQRNDLLYKSDWTQIPGGPLTDEKKAEWATYRQQLRDLVIEGSCPLDFVWPTPPT